MCIQIITSVPQRQANCWASNGMVEAEHQGNEAKHFLCRRLCRRLCRTPDDDFVGNENRWQPADREGFCVYVVPKCVCVCVCLVHDARFYTYSKHSNGEANIINFLRSIPSEVLHSPARIKIMIIKYRMTHSNNPGDKGWSRTMQN